MGAGEEAGGGGRGSCPQLKLLVPASDHVRPAMRQAKAWKGVERVLSTPTHPSAHPRTCRDGLNAVAVLVHGHVAALAEHNHVGLQREAVAADGAHGLLVVGPAQTRQGVSASTGFTADRVHW